MSLLRSMEIGRLAAVSGGECRGDSSVTVTGITYDSRQVIPGDLFAAITGADADGHCFASEAVSRGAGGLVVERPLDLGVPEIVVNHGRAALAPISATFFANPSRQLRVIGVTGTDGKTTTCYLIDTIFRMAGFQTGMIGTVAVRIGDRTTTHDSRQTTPESVDIQRYLRQMVDANVTLAIVEATSHGLAMHRLDHVQVAIAAVTNVAHEHLDFHGDVNSYRDAKRLLFDRTLSGGGIAVVNADDEGARSMVRGGNGASRVIWYGSGPGEASLYTEAIVSGVHGSQFTLVSADGSRATVNLPLVGRFNVDNALCAAGVAWASGLTLEQIASGLEAIEPVPGRMVRIDEGQPFSVVVDYAHTPEALAKVLDLLRTVEPDGRVIVVVGSAGERDVEKRARQGAVASRLADVSVFTTEDPRFEDPDEIIQHIVEGAISVGGREGRDFYAITDRTEAIRAALSLAKPGDRVLLAGKGHESSIIWGREKRPWDESATARTLLRQLGFGKKR